QLSNFNALKEQPRSACLFYLYTVFTDSLLTAFLFCGNQVPKKYLRVLTSSVLPLLRAWLRKEHRSYEDTSSSMFEVGSCVRDRAGERARHQRSRSRADVDGSGCGKCGSRRRSQRRQRRVDRPWFG